MPFTSNKVQIVHSLVIEHSECAPNPEENVQLTTVARAAFDPLPLRCSPVSDTRSTTAFRVYRGGHVTANVAVQSAPTSPCPFASNDIQLIRHLLGISITCCCLAVTATVSMTDPRGWNDDDERSHLFLIVISLLSKITKLSLLMEERECNGLVKLSERHSLPE